MSVFVRYLKGLQQKQCFTYRAYPKAEEIGCCIELNLQESRVNK